MLRSIKQFFDQHMRPGGGERSKGAHHAVQVATAALLFEVMRTDGELKETEGHAVAAAIEKRFGLKPRRDRRAAAPRRGAGRGGHRLLPVHCAHQRALHRRTEGAGRRVPVAGGGRRPRDRPLRAHPRAQDRRSAVRTARRADRGTRARPARRAAKRQVAAGLGRLPFETVEKRGTGDGVPVSVGPGGARPWRHARVRAAGR